MNSEQQRIPEDFRLQSYQFDLPPDRIAQFPPERRGDSRLMVLARGPESDYPPTLIHDNFSALAAHLPKQALLVVNNSKVLQARLLGRRPSGGKMEFLLLTPLPLLLAEAKEMADGWFSAPCEGLFKTGKKVGPNDSFVFAEDLSLTILENGPFGRRKVQLFWKGDLTDIFTRIGHIPLPPYIARKDGAMDAERYQTVYARGEKIGSVAAPTAGLHFTPALLASLASAGIELAEVTLYVGYGTFSPVRVADIREHAMHSEYVEIGGECCEKIQNAKERGQAVIAVGTTSLRALEAMMQNTGTIAPYSGWTDIFLYPGQPFRLVDGLITNFHLPGSSLLMLVSGFAGRRRILHAYARAVEEGYRFFSYGDAMCILPFS